MSGERDDEKRENVPPPHTTKKDFSEWDVVSAITLFSKEWVKAVDMAYVDDADSPTTESWW